MKPRTTVDLLEPRTEVDEYTQEPSVDWDTAPIVHVGVPAAVEPLTSTEDVLTAATLVGRSRCYLPAGTRVEAWWRVRWLGDDYLIEGDVEKWIGMRGEAYQVLILKKVTG